MSSTTTNEAAFGVTLKPTLPALALRPRDAAASLGMSPSSLQRLTREGKVPHVRVGALILYPTLALEKWLLAESQKQGQENMG